MAAADLAYLSATEALALFRKRKLSPVELMRAVIRRCERANPTVNALAFTHFDRALDQARVAEARYARGGRPRPLEGLPLAVKDDHEIEGEITTHGSYLFKDKVCTRTDIGVARLLKAGAIVHARTTTPEFAAASVTYSPLWGVTRNPWNPRFTPGGSTGGGGAALAAGMTVLADGGDYAGSIRTPASCCGVFGFKPPYGRVPGDPPWNLNAFSSYGPLTRSVADGALMMNLIAGHDHGDPTSVRERVRYPAAYPSIKGPSLKGWRVAYSLDLGYCEVHPDVRRNTLAAVAAFREAGCIVEEVDLGWTWDALRAWIAYAVAFDDENIAHLPSAKRRLLSDYIRGYNDPRIKPPVPPMTFAEGRAYRAEMWRRLGPVLERNRVFLCPTLAVPAVAADLSPMDTSFRINGTPIPAGLGWLMTYPFNALAYVPAASVPSGFARTGVPTGLQIVGRPYDDRSVFQAAAAFESLRPWRGRTPKL